MSRLITSGDTLSNFGKYLPAPYIDKIYIQDGTVITAGTAGLTTAKITVDVFVYLRVTEDTDVASLEKDLENLRFYVYFANNLSESVLEEIFASKQYMPSSDVIGDGDGGYLRFSSFTAADTLQYDDNGNKIIKYYGTWTLESDTLGWSNIENSYLFTYSYTEEFEEDPWYSAWSNVLHTLDDVERSEISYEVIMENGKLASQEEIIWVDDQGSFYDGTGLQALSSKYYKSDKITHSEIVDSFQSLLDEYETSAKTDSALQSIVDQISYILATSAMAPDLVPQLNLLRRAFPSKSSATTPGELYLKYREKIYTANAVIETDGLLSKRLISNAKLIDQRAADPDDIATPDERASSDGWKMIGTKIGWINSHYDSTTLGLYKEQMDLYGYTSLEDWMLSTEYTSWLGVEEISPAPTATDYAYSWFYKGYIFHDYTAEVLQNCAVGDHIDLKTYLDYFDPQTLYRYYYPSKIEFSRGVTDEMEAGTRYTMTQTITNWTPDSAGFTFEHGSKPGNTVPSFTLDQFQTATGESETAYAFCTIRNFLPYNYEAGLTGDYWSGNYRILGFQFQDIDKLAGPDEETYGAGTDWTDAHGMWADESNYKFTITYQDTTEALLPDLFSAYLSALVDLQAYLTTASDYIAYNIIDGHWNDHFKEEMHNMYDGEPGSAPWDYYPVYYNVFREIVSQTFGGDENLMLADSADIAATISPDTGTMEQLEAFVAMFESFYYDIILTLDVVALGANLYEREAMRTFYPEVDYPTSFIIGGSHHDDDREYRTDSEQDDLATWIDYVQTDVTTVVPTDTGAEMREDPEYEFLVNGETATEAGYTDEEGISAGDLGWTSVGTDASFTIAFSRDDAETISLSMGEVYLFKYMEIFDPDAVDAYTPEPVAGGYYYLAPIDVAGVTIDPTSAVFPALLDYFSLVGTPAEGYDVEEHVVPFVVTVTTVQSDDYDPHASPSNPGTFDVWFTINPTEELYGGMSSYTLKTNWTNHTELPTGYSGILINPDAWGLYAGGYKALPDLEYTFKTEYGDYSDVLAEGIAEAVEEAAEAAGYNEEDCFDAYGLEYASPGYTPCDSATQIWIPWDSGTSTGCKCVDL